MVSGGTEVSFNGGQRQGWMDEPIDGEWLESRGFTKKSTSEGNFYWQSGLLVFRGHVEFCCEPLKHIKTKVDMLAAIEILLPSTK